MTPRLNAFAVAPAPMKSWLDFSQGLLKRGLEESLMDLVEIRASQINGCAFCLDMHTADAPNEERRNSVSTCSTPGANSALQRPRAGSAGLDGSPDLAA